MSPSTARPQAAPAPDEEETRPPRASASVLLLREGCDGLQVLLLRRHPGTEVLGGYYVFPGGKLDAADCTPDWLPVLDQPEADFAHQLNEPHTPSAQARGLHLAALRELHEEAGVLLAAPAERARSLGCWPPLDLQKRLEPGLPWPEALHAHGLQAHTAALRPWSRWITPRSPVVGTARFDTRFFLALLPPGQQAQPDQREAVEALWLAPREALQRHWAHELELIAPQLMALAELARFDSAAAAWQQALARRAPCIEPAPFAEGALRGLCYPGDPCHPQPERLLPGPTRLRVLGRRFEPVDGFEGWFA
ncbi:MAG: NUDIX hydrolase [Betaproteobacteria bacterium]|nr:NUDIX hydrolase [Betaproteobacteria bacterium]